MVSSTKKVCYPNLVFQIFYYLKIPRKR